MATMDLSNPRTARRCRAVIQQCSLALTRACKKSPRITSKTLATTLTEESFILTEDDAVGLPCFVKPRHLCFDLEGTADLGPQARVVPPYLESARPFLVALGTPSAFDKPKGAPSVAVSVAPPGLGLDGWIRSQFNNKVCNQTLDILLAGVRG